jgi:hypothetical protein
MKIITIANRDDNCQDCKLTVEYKFTEKPSWWRRLLFKDKPITRIKVDVWYGHDMKWNSGPSSFTRPPIGKASYFSRIWKHHMIEKNRLGIKGPYKSVIDLSTGVTDGFKTQGKDQEIGGGARVVQLDDYRASRGSKES